MALIELARVAASDPAAARRWGASPLPLSDRLATMITSRLADLPDSTKSALLNAAVADSSDIRSAIASGTAHLEPDVLLPAEEFGLIRVRPGGLEFTHPLVRSAVYQSAPFARRAAAHRQVAEALHDQPDRVAWHLATATLSPDEHVAALLEETAGQTQRRSGAVSAAVAMERAAELSVGRDERARRLVAAASLALATGEAGWVQDLADRAIAITSDPVLRLSARQSVGWTLAWSNQQDAALSVLLSVAKEAVDHDRPDAIPALPVRDRRHGG